ncbi:MAG: hypothetical protein WBQ17_06115 [Rhizomicrobium sp.]|jgi:hypothetical protein
MNTSSTDGEVYGANALYAAMVIGAVALLLGSIWSPAPVNAAGPPTAPQVQIASAGPAHVS